MKYIKTNTNIFEVVDQNDLVYYVRSVSNKHKIYSKSKCNITLLKQSDYIEKLCDVFIAISRHNDKHIYSILPDKTTISLNGYQQVYGAIWINTGLKYVAQLDENGELQLL